MLDAIQFGMILPSHFLYKKINSMYSTLKTRAVVSLYIHATHNEGIKYFS